MALTIDDLDLRIDLPEIPDSVAVPILEPVSLDERRRAIDAFSARLSLRRLEMAQLTDSIVFASERGEIEYFPASGAIWARDATAELEHENELRKWAGLERVESGGNEILRPDRETAAMLIRTASEMLDEAGLIEEEQGSPRITLDQVAELDERGKVIRSGAGSATITYDYTMGGLPVFGAGAKTQIFADPGRRGPQITGGFHSWRKAVDSHDVVIGGIKAALSAGVLRDPELVLYHEKGGRIEVTHLEFGYLALPAMVQQRSLMPSFQIEGRVHVRDSKMEYFEFARYQHAASTDEYAAVGLFDYHLGVMN
jgi:hypothetical protein